MKTFGVVVASVMLLLTACSSHPSVPAQFTSADKMPAIYPDYIDVTIPSNIAPLNFMSADPAVSEVVARIAAADGSMQTYGDGPKVMIAEDEWQSLRDASRGASLRVELFCRTAEGWTAYPAFRIHVADADIDPYVSYRLLDPSYVLYRDMSICQRNLTNFDERQIFNNRLTDGEGQGQCINCHSYQDYKTDNMLFHVRGRHGSTVLVVDGEVRTVNLKRPNTISAGVYPAWHPTERRIAFSTDLTHQWFHTQDADKVEVFDTQSDLVLYDIDTDSVSIIAADTTRMEVFPTWSPDGKWLYYCSTDVWQADSTNQGDYRVDYVYVHYNVYRRSYEAGRFGDEELVYNADSLGRSCSLPRISPDGQFLAFAEGTHGYFNIWHRQSDVRVMCLADGKMLQTMPVNTSSQAESYPTWSSNGRWLMCASRRDDGAYSRIVMSYFDGRQFGKAFMLPQRDPAHNQLRMQSYNRPEFMTEEVRDLKQEIARQLTD